MLEAAAYWLSDLPTTLAVIVSIFVGASLSALGLLAAHSILPHGVRRAHNDVSGFTFATVGVIYAVLLAFVAVAVWQNFAQTDNPNVVSTLGQARKAPIVSLSWIPQSTEATTVLPSPFSVKAKLAKRHSKFAGTIIAAPAAHNEVCNEESESPSRCSSIGMVASNRDSRSS